ncbi:MAG: hypothetical protein IPK50_10545 [Fibrobacterota bacterium]|nr:hypothetical protein [Fibrobacterota bacterium]QQS07315.1 MAG: hypothetical protein IPK50_10545 [Fibrobacterota bacterium]
MIHSRPFLKILCLLSASSFAQAFGDPISAARSSPATALERAYEKSAHDALVRYFAEKTFLVKAKVEMDPAPEPSNAQERMPRLPGIPYQPMSGEATAPSLDESIGAVGLDVLVDTSYTQRDRDFIQYLVVVAANLDTARGDLVRVGRAAFPRDDRSLHRAVAWKDPVREPAASKTDSVRPPSDSAASVPEQGMIRQVADRLLSQLPLIVVCLSVLAAIWILRRPAPAPAAKASDAPQPSREASQPAQDSASGKTSPVSSSGGSSQDLRSLRPFLVNSFIGDPRTCGQILRSWVEHDRAKGAHEAGVLIAGLNPRLLETVRETLGEDGAKLVEGQIAAKEDIPEEEFLGAAREFRREFQVATQRHGDRRQSDLFGFLEQLNEGQILHIIKDEAPGIAGFVLAQVPSAKAANILQGLDSPTRAKFLHAIGSITQIPMEIYKDIADRLSLRAMEVANMKFVAADGVESLLKLIESLPVDQQFPYIHSLSEVDLNLAKKLRARTVTLQEVPSLPEKLLASRLQSQDPQVLALVLPRYDSASRDRMFSMLPDRMRQLVQSSLEVRKTATPQDVEAACQAFLKSFRDEIRQNGRGA